MAGDDDLHKQFEALIAGAGLDDLRTVSHELMAADALGFGLLRPNRRRPRLPDVFIYLIRVDLDRSEPPIWRTLELRSDLTLDVIHSVLQSVFGWTDSHLHRFSLGGGPFDRDSQLFLCPFDVEEGEEEGIPDEEVRLDEALQDVGDVLQYIYDYGDSWELTLRLEQVRKVSEDATAALCVDGQRAAPPEDCGGITRGEDLAKVLEDPAFFDIEAANHWLLDPFLIMRKAGVHAALTDVLLRLMGTPVAEAVVTEALRLTEPGPSLTEREFLSSLRAVQWYLDRAQTDGIPLTESGYMQPADVEQASAIVPTCSGMDTVTRESQAVPLVSFRQALQELGLLRKRKGRLLLTKAGQTARVQPDKLWGHLASRLIPDKPGFERDAAVVVLLFAAGSPDQDLPAELIGAVMAALGWRAKDGTAADFDDVRLATRTMDILYNIAELPDERKHPDISRVAAALAWEALFWEG